MNKSQKAKARRGQAPQECIALAAELDTIPVDVPLPAIMPKKVLGIDVAFGPSKISEWLPARRDIPKSFYSSKEGQAWIDFVASWFHSGADPKRLVHRPFVDRTQAVGHVRACLVSFEPSHEDKIEGCAYLLSLWFEPLK